MAHQVPTHRLQLVCPLLLALAAPLHAQIHTKHDHVPDLCGPPTVRSVASGPWTSSATWSPAREPRAGDRVLVSSDTVVSLAAQMAYAVECVAIDGQLALSATERTLLWAGTVLVGPRGLLSAGDEATPVHPENLVAIVVADRPIDSGRDPDSYGTGIIVAGGLRLHGAKKTPTWTRLASEPLTGTKTLHLAEPVLGWRPGDRVVLPDTRHMRWHEVKSWSPVVSQSEEAQIAAVSEDGRTVTLQEGLRFDHRGARNAGGALDLLPHIGNLSRNIVVRSEKPVGTPGATLGHVMLTARAAVDVRYTHFTQLGRTTIDKLDDKSNHIGRYAVHAHHLVGPTKTPANGYQFTLIGNAIDGTSTRHRLKWGLVIHDSHYGLIQDNVFYNWSGSAVMFEDGSESFNVLDRNFAIRSQGEGGRSSLGTEGGGFWFRGPNNYIRNNVAADLWSSNPEGAYGYKFFLQYLGRIRIPKSKGADPAERGQFVELDANAMPVLEFDNNEVYTSAQGLTYWWVNAYGEIRPEHRPAPTVFRNTTIWHVFNVGVYHYPSDGISFDGLKIRGGQPGDISHCCSIGFFGSDYAYRDLVIRNADIQGMKTGLQVPMLAHGAMTVADSLFRNEADIVTETMWNVGGGRLIKPRTVTITNTRFGPPGYKGRPHRTIQRRWGTGARPASAYNVSVKDDLTVLGYQGVVGADFRVYYGAQATEDIAGGVAPCRDERKEIDGLVCPIQ